MKMYKIIYKVIVNKDVHNIKVRRISADTIEQAIIRICQMTKTDYPYSEVEILKITYIPDNVTECEYEQVVKQEIVSELKDIILKNRDVLGLNIDTFNIIIDLFYDYMKR